MSDKSFQIDIETEYLVEESEPNVDRFVFTYTITITNLGVKAARLNSRHWIITDANGEISEVKGQGVVGEQPRIEPSASYQYTSGAILETPIGTMEGSYQMETDDGEQFDAKIPVFSLSQPGVLH